MIFVFGSNLAGRHGRGAAKSALTYEGAIYGQGVGRQGNSYAIPTKGWKMETLPVVEIKNYVDQFIEYARTRPQEQFFVTKVGCGLAGYTPDDIAPLFELAPENCVLPDGWRNYKLQFPNPLTDILENFIIDTQQCGYPKLSKIILGQRQFIDFYNRFIAFGKSIQEKYTQYVFKSHDSYKYRDIKIELDQSGQNRFDYFAFEFEPSESEKD